MSVRDIIAEDERDKRVGLAILNRTDEERRKFLEDPAIGERLLSHLQQQLVPEKKRMKLAIGSSLAKVEESIPEGDPRKGLGAAALELTRKILPTAPAGTHPTTVLSGVYDRLLKDKTEEANLFAQKEESALFGKSNVPKPPGYEEWKQEFLKKSKPADIFTNPLESAALGAGFAGAGEIIRRTLAKDVAVPGAVRASALIAKGLAGESLAGIPTMARTLTKTGEAVAKLPIGGWLAKKAMTVGATSVGTKLLGRLLSATPPVGPVGVGMKIAGAALMFIPDIAMLDLSKHLIKTAAPEWSAQRPLATEIASLGVAAPGMRLLHKGLSRALTAKTTAEEAASAATEVLAVKPTAENMLVSHEKGLEALTKTDDALSQYLKVVDWKGGIKSEVAKPILDTHVGGISERIALLEEEALKTGVSKTEAAGIARDAAKQGIGLELLNASLGSPIKDLGPIIQGTTKEGIDRILKSVSEGADLKRAVNDEFLISGHFGVNQKVKVDEATSEILNQVWGDESKTATSEMPGTMMGEIKKVAGEAPAQNAARDAILKERETARAELLKKSESSINEPSGPGITTAAEDLERIKQDLIKEYTTRDIKPLSLEEATVKAAEEAPKQLENPDVVEIAMQEAERTGEISGGTKKLMEDKMNAYLTNPASLSDKEFVAMHNTEMSVYHKEENIARYKSIIAANDAAAEAALKATPKQVRDLGKEILMELGPEEHSAMMVKIEKDIEAGIIKDTPTDVLKVMHAATNYEFMRSIAFALAAGGTMIGLSQLDPAQAAGPDFALRSVPKVVAQGLKPLKEGMKAYFKTWDAASLLSPEMSADGMSVTKFQKGVIVPASTENISRKKKLPFGLDRILSPYTLGIIYYGPKGGVESLTNPAVAIASAQTAWINNAQASLKAFQKTMDTYGIKSAHKEVAAGMKPLVDKYQETLSESAAHYKNLSKLRKVIEGGEKEVLKASAEDKEEVMTMLVGNKLDYDTSLKIVEKNAAKIKDYQAEHSVVIQDLASKYPSVRVSLQMEEQAGKEDLYPWLKGMIQPNEMAASARMKGMMEQYAARMVEVGQKPITTKGYVHYAGHPDVDYMKIAKQYEGMETGGDAAHRLIKFYERSVGGKNMMPDIFYSMERYIPDANRRIAVGDFWGKGRRDGWYAHSNSMIVKGNSGLSTFWNTIKTNFDPFESTTLNRMSDRIQSFEIMRLLAFSPSVSFKHAIKLEANWSNFGWLESMKMMPETGAMWARRMTPDWALKNPTIENTVVRSFVNQGMMARVISDMETIQVPRNWWDKTMLWANKHGSIMIDAVENFDRAHSLVAAGTMAAKKGMTAQQAAYGIMDTILKTNFLSGAMNPSWLRDPKVRLLFLFQGTPFKIAEQRAIQLWRGGKAIGRAGMETLDLLANLKSDIKEGEHILKYTAIMDALKSEKDIWGTPITQQLMRKIFILGGAITAGKYAFDAEMFGHVVHAPFFQFNDKSISFRLNPMASAAYETWQKKEEGDSKLWFASDFLKTWLKDPFIQNNVIKAMRLSKNDIPEMYKDSRVRYLLGVPATKE